MNLFAHLPFSTLRDGKCSDYRTLADKGTLRRSIEIPRVKTLRTTADSTKWIHQTQISIHISILEGQSCWTAYVFEDTFYKKGDEYERFTNSLRESSSLCLDALAGAVGSGKLDSTLTTDPREYYLAVFEARVEQAHLAWAEIVGELEKTVKE